MVDSLRFLGPVCYSSCGILAHLVWMETRDHDKLGNASLFVYSCNIIKLTPNENKKGVKIVFP